MTAWLEHVDDDAAGDMRLDHVGRHTAGHLRGGAGVDLHNLVKGLGTDGGGRLQARDTSAVDQAVQGRQALQGLVEGGAVGDVQAQGVTAQLRQGLGVAAKRKDFGAAGDQLPGNFAADAHCRRR